MTTPVGAPEAAALRPRHVLFLGAANSARSILAEAILNARGAGRFCAHSAGATPSGSVHPAALDTLARMGLPTADLRSKSWDEFGSPGAPRLDFVIGVCDAAAGEPCPHWPGAPLRADWGLPDPLAVLDDEGRAQALRDTYAALGRRIDALLELPFAELAPEALRERIQALAVD